MNDEELLKKLYYNNFITSIKPLYEQAKAAHPKITMKIVKEWYKNQSATQLNNKARVGKKIYKPIYSESNYAFQIDLTFFPRYETKNDGYWVLYTAININTRFAYAYHMKDKDMDTILRAFKAMHKQTEINVVQCDLGSEFNNKEFIDFCEKENIILDMFKSDSHKLGIINRFHRTIKLLIN